MNTIYRIPNSEIYFDTQNMKILFNKDNVELKKIVCKSEIKEKKKSLISMGIIGRLTMQVTNMCNLKCTYCYEKNKKNKTLTEIKALEIIEKVFTKYDVRNIMFFGGEPTLNLKIIEKICKGLNTCDQRFKFGMISNLFFNESTLNHLISLIKTYDLKLTVSIDGPQYLHDVNRKTKNNLGSFETVKKNYLALINNNIHPGIECTYTYNHFSSNYSIIELIKFFEEEFANKNVHIAPDTNFHGNNPNDYDKLIRNYCEAIAFVINAKANSNNISFSLADRILDSLIHKKEVEYFCPAIVSDIAVDINGDLYPCFIMYNELNNKIASLENLHSKALNNLIKINQKQSPRCNSCWIKKICFGCIKSDFNHLTQLPKANHCRLMKSIVTECILRISEISLGKTFESFGINHRFNKN
jgi:uncharacterized protein